MPHQDQGGLADALDWLAASTLFGKYTFRSDCVWTLWSLVRMTLLWAWGEESTLTDRYAAAGEITRRLPDGQRELVSYQAFLKLLTRHSGVLLFALLSMLQRRLQQDLAGCYRVSGMLAFGVDGTRVELPRTAANQRAFTTTTTKETDRYEGEGYDYQVGLDSVGDVDYFQHQDWESSDQTSKVETTRTLTAYSPLGSWVVPLTKASGEQQAQDGTYHQSDWYSWTFATDPTEWEVTRLPNGAAPVIGVLAAPESTPSGSAPGIDEVVYGSSNSVALAERLANEKMSSAWWGGAWNPGNWHRLLYTGDSGSTDLDYALARGAAGDSYNDNKDTAHFALDFAAEVPGIGAAADAANAGLYLAEGEYGSAAESGASALSGGLGKWKKRADRALGAAEGASDASKNADRFADLADAAKTSKNSKGAAKLNKAAEAEVVVPKGGIGPVNKGKAGEELQNIKVLAEGDTIEARQPTFELPSGKRSRPDKLTQSASGKNRVREAKNGESARLTENQKELKEAIENGDAVIPRGSVRKKQALSPEFQPR